MMFIYMSLYIYILCTTHRSLVVHVSNDGHVPAALPEQVQHLKTDIPSHNITQY